MACAGARPVALVNCLNFGNPEHPEVMWQFSEAIDGMAEACLALGIPVVGGNVSFYNESRGTDIDPTPVVGTLGPGRPAASRVLPTPAFDRWQHGHAAWAVRPGGYIAGRFSMGGAMPGGQGRPAVPFRPLDLELHARLLHLVAALVNERLVDGIHDVSDGGLGVALAEMAVKSGTGCRVNGLAGYEELFGEGPSRVLLSVPPATIELVTGMAQAAGIPVIPLGTGGGDRLVVEGLIDIAVAEATAAWKAALPAAFSTAGAKRP